MMDFAKGQKVLWRTARGGGFQEAEAVSAGDGTVVLRAAEAPGSPLAPGAEVIIRSGGEEYFTRLVECSGREMRLRAPRSENRKYFRVDDVFPVVFRRVRAGSPRRANLFSADGGDIFDLRPPEGAGDPELWRRLNSINSKIGLLIYSFETSGGAPAAGGEDLPAALGEIDGALEDVLSMLGVERGEFIRTTSREVNVSAAGIRLRVPDRLNVGDSLEVRMLLPTTPAVGVVTDGTVVRVEPAREGGYEVALGFSEMDEEVRDEIIRYALGRQREFIRQRKRQGE
ncbi:MAG: hypothetical protein Kow0025_04100 [Thermodesulfovibrionales bacterium]